MTELHSSHNPSSSDSVSSRFFKALHIDVPLFLGLLILSAIGFAVLFSASDQNSALLHRQIARVGIAFFIMLVMAQIPPDQLKRNSLMLYLTGIILLLSVLWVGDVGKGAQRWLHLGLFRFQPSEMIKMTTPMMIAWYLCQRALPPDSRTFFCFLHVDFNSCPIDCQTT